MPQDSEKPENASPEEIEASLDTLHIHPDEDELAGDTQVFSTAEKLIDEIEPDDEDGNPTISDTHETHQVTVTGEFSERTDDSRIVGCATSVEGPVTQTVRSNRIRSALIIALVLFSTAWTIVNFGLLQKQQTQRGFRYDNLPQNNFIINSVNPALGDTLCIGDLLVAIDGEPFSRERFIEIESTLPPNGRYTLSILRDGEPLSVELPAIPLTLSDLLGHYLLGLLLPLAYIGVGAATFFPRPNDKTVLLLTAAFCFVALAVPPDSNSYFINQLSAPVNFAFRTLNSLGMFSTSLLLVLFLNFPQPLPLIRRRPFLEKLIYAASFVFCVLPFWLGEMYMAGWLQLPYISRSSMIVFSNILMGIFLLAALVALWTGYLGAGRADRRRIQIIVVGFAVVAVPNVLSLVVSIALKLFTGDWLFFFLRSLTILLPFIFAYAIIKHKVIPISFVIRRGLQYLLATNALRLMLLLPIIGIVWNAADRPERPLAEILFRNTADFYICLAFAVLVLALNRFGLRDWIDKKFFREQYDAEVILGQLTDAIKESDSISTLSRLVSGRIESALHPTKTCLFFREEDLTSGFSLTYTTTGHETDKLKVAADSAILDFMQDERHAIEFPGDKTLALADAEHAWLKALDTNLLVPMHGSDGKLAGFFTLGEKMSEIPYTRRDKEMLEDLADQIALVHENLTLKDLVRQEQKIRVEVLSRVDPTSLNLLKECPKCGHCFDREAVVCLHDGVKLIFTLPVERTLANRYRLERLIGKGGMGAVYEARDGFIDRSVAVKILSGAMFGNQEALRRFEREAKTTGRISHRNIVTVFDYGLLATEGAFLVMEMVNGRSLREFLKNGKTLDKETAADWFGQILDGLDSAHRAGIVHRDLKPENVLITRDESRAVRVCILDFGLARQQEVSDYVTTPGTIMGTMGYMSPEQLTGERADRQSDLFSVAVMLHEALVGKRPFPGKSYIELVNSMSKGFKPVNEDATSTFFKRGLAFEVRERYVSAIDMKREMTAILNK